MIFYRFANVSPCLTSQRLIEMYLPPPPAAALGVALAYVPCLLPADIADPYATNLRDSIFDILYLKKIIVLYLNLKYI